MSDALNAKSQAFLRSVQDDDDPSREDYDRVRAGVKGRLAASVAAGVAALATAKTAAASQAAAVTATTTVAAGAAGGTTAAIATGAAIPASGVGAALVTKLAAVVLVVGAVAGGTTAIVSSRQSSPATTTTAPVDIAPSAHNLKNPPRVQPPAIPPAIAAPAPSVETATLVATATVTSTAVAPPSPAPVIPMGTPAATAPATAAAETAPVPSPLDAEIALVRDAREALRVGNPARALALLDDHARRFSGGALAEDSDALRIQALCALGRAGEARGLATRFLASHSASPYAPSVRASCGGGGN